MRTTIRLPDTLLRQAKRFAAQTNQTLTALIEESLRTRLAQRKTAAVAGPIDLPTFGARGLLPGVDLDDSAALLDLMGE